MDTKTGKGCRAGRLRTVRRVAAGLVLLLAGAACLGVSRWGVPLLQVQAGPALMRAAAGLTLGAAVTLLLLAGATLLFGRVYCAVLCPLGALQEGIGLLTGRFGKAPPDLPWLRYALAALAVGMTACGWTLPFMLLDPYSLFGRMSGAFLVGGWIPLAALAVLVTLRRRLFCTALCPVGTLLGLLSRKTPFRIALTDRCVRCGKCVKVCPAGCLDPKAGTADNERCLRCLACTAVCPTGGVVFGRAPAKPLSRGRRGFLLHGVSLAGGLAAGAAVGSLPREALRPPQPRILPPGAGDPDRFAARCTGCQLCVRNCPHGIIVPGPGGYGSVSLEIERNCCSARCTRCSNVCPTGALTPLTLETKRRTRIAQAVYAPGSCVLGGRRRRLRGGAGEDGPAACGRCVAKCPTGALTAPPGGGRPRFDASRCIGCGICRRVCPGGAFRIEPVNGPQRLLELPRTPGQDGPARTGKEA